MRFLLHPGESSAPRAWRAEWPHPPAWWLLLILAATYTLGAGLGQGLRLIPGVSITFWPPAGVFVAVLLSFPRRAWGRIVLAACVGEMTGNLLWFHNPWGMALVYFSANALEALTAAWLIGRILRRPPTLSTFREVAALVTVGSVLAPVVGATIIASADAWIGKHAFATAWGLVWLGDSTGLLVGTPLTLAVIYAWRRRTATPMNRAWEAAGVAALLSLVAWLSVRGVLPSPYLALPVLMWGVVRFQVRGAVAGLALLTLVTALGARGAVGGALESPVAVAQRVVQWQVFLGISAVTVLLVGVLSGAHERARARLATLNRRLEQRVAQRTARLRESEARFRNLADGLPLLLWVIDPQGRTEFLNSTFRRYFSLAPSAEGEPLPATPWAEHLHPDDAGAFGAALAHALQTREPVHVIARARRGDAWRWIESWARPRLSETGEFLGLVGTSADITLRRQAEDELALHRLHLEQLVARRTAEVEASQGRLRLAERLAALGTLAAGLGHDLGNILVPLRVRVDELERACTSEASREHLDAIGQSLQYLRSLASGLRALALDPDDQAGEGASTQLNAWWKDLRGLVRASLPRSITIHEPDFAGVPAVAIPPHALTQAVFNLLQNAGDALRGRPDAAVWVSARVHGTDVHLHVRDNGPGMTDDVRARCVEPFFTTKARERGTGLGLSIIHSQVARRGGRLLIDSSPGQGATFTLVLPIAGRATRAELTGVVTIKNEHLRALACAVLRGRGVRVATAPESPPRADLWVVDEGVPSDLVRMFQRQDLRRRTVCVGGSPDVGSSTMTVTDRRPSSVRSVLGAMVKSMQTMPGTGAPSRA